MHNIYAELILQLYQKCKRIESH